MQSIECLNTGIIYRNPKPHLRSVHAYFPSVVVLSDNELLAVLVLGSAFESTDFHVHVARSKDGGASWALEGPLYEPPTDRLTTDACRITRMPDGEIVALLAVFERPDPEEGLASHETLGFVPMEFVLLRSRDDGHTWTDPEPIASPLVGPAFELCCPILPQKSGRWLLPTSTWKSWEGDCPNGMKAIAFASTDQGKTWPEYVDVMDGYADSIIHWEQKIIELDGDRLMSVAWGFNEAEGVDLPNQYALSEDGGRHFGPPKSTGLLGQTLTPIRLPDGRILCVYRRMDQPGLWANLSRIEGDQWVNGSDAPLWGANTTGLLKNGPTENMAADFNVLKFGAPCATLLPNGEVFVAFWCVEDCVSNIRWLRVKIQ
ncbi:MAG: exo-alpha-sialidase [Candidatus Latescibacteria bacterium]|nr:exo-alpha-sialidase [Candidatus Latescibacterota bacterium]